MDAIAEIIKKMSTSSTNVNPTEIYNEGWMTRLLMYYSVKEGIAFIDIGINLNGTFKNIKWTSEALLSSPFVSAKSKREGYTHPDISIGDFSVDYKVSGKIEVNENAEVFGIIEAKMKSPLSKETRNAEDYNQASRSVACIASNTKDNCKTFFYVVLPELKKGHVKRDKTKITDIVNKDFICKQIEERVIAHNKVNTSDTIDIKLIKRVEECKVGVITYEDWIKAFENHKIKKELEEFYEHCKTYNKIK